VKEMFFLINLICKHSNNGFYWFQTRSSGPVLSVSEVSEFRTASLAGKCVGVGSFEIYFEETY
jgi:hypothetical protein